MNYAMRIGQFTGQFRRNACRWSALIAVLLLVTGCGDELQREFRQAAIGGVESGVNSIVDGLLDGLFTIADPSSDSSSTSDGSTTTGGAESS